MASPGVGLPAPVVGVVDASGALTTPWRRFFEALWTKTGKYAEISFQPTSDTNLQVSYRGSDGVVRTGNITLS